MEFKLIKGDPLKLKSNVLVIGKFEEESISKTVKKVNEALKGAISQLIEEESYKSVIGKTLNINTVDKTGSDRILLVGLGKKSEFSPSSFKNVGIAVAKKVKSFASRVIFNLDIEGNIIDFGNSSTVDISFASPFGGCQPYAINRRDFQTHQ